MKMFFITYAGGNAKFFQCLFPYIHDLECIAIDYSGHGNRHNEKLNETLPEMITDIADKINEQIILGEPYALLGYSMGSIVVYEIAAQRLLKQPPVHIFVCAHYAPSISSIHVKYSELSDMDLVKSLASFGGINEQFISDKRFWPFFLRIVRNDYKLLESYEFENLKKLLDIDVSVLYSDQDTPFQYIEPWKYITKKTVEFKEYPGTHFFLKENAEHIALYILNKI